MNRIFQKIPIFLLCCFFFCPHPLLAESNNSSLEEARELLYSGKYQRAKDELGKLFKKDPGNPEVNFYLGRAAFELGYYETAVMAFDRVLITDPGAIRVKLEMARSYIHLGALETARQLFEEVRATDPPPMVETRIISYLELIDQKTRRHFWSGSLETGISYDDNVRQTPTSDLISIGVFEFLLTGSTAEAQSDQIYNTVFNLNHHYRMEREGLSWKTSFLSYNDFYESNENLDVYYLNLASGPEWEIGNWLWSNYADLKYIEVGQDRYLSSYGFGSSLKIPVDSWLNFNLTGRIEEKNNYNDTLKDATNVLFSFQPTFSLGKNRISINLRQQYENSEADYESYDRFSWRLRYDRLLPAQFLFYASLGRMATDYDGIEPLFTEKRSDELDEISTGISRLLWKAEKGSLRLLGKLGFLYLDSESNLDLYKYRKKKVSFSLTMRF